MAEYSFTHSQNIDRSLMSALIITQHKNACVIKAGGSTHLLGVNICNIRKFDNLTFSNRPRI